MGGSLKNIINYKQLTFALLGGFVWCLCGYSIFWILGYLFSGYRLSTFINEQIANDRGWLNIFLYYYPVGTIYSFFFIKLKISASKVIYTAMIFIMLIINKGTPFLPLDGPIYFDNNQLSVCFIDDGFEFQFFLEYILGPVCPIILYYLLSRNIFRRLGDALNT